MCLELPIHPALRTRRGRITDGGADHLATDDAAQTLLAHEPLDGAACHGHSLSVLLLPDLVGVINLHRGATHALDVLHEDIVAPSAGATTGRARCSAAWRR